MIRLKNATFRSFLIIRRMLARLKTTKNALHPKNRHVSNMCAPETTATEC